MLYGITDGDTGLIVAAADEPTEFDAFASALPGDDLLSAWEFAGTIEMLTEARFKGFKRPPLVISHTDGAQRDTFVAKHSIELCLPNALRDKQRHMLLVNAPDRYATRPESERGKTLAEIHGLTERDRWDRRTEEQKEFDAKMKAMAEEMRKKGELTGSSFGPGAATGADGVTPKETSKPKDGDESDIHVSEVKAHRAPDGSIIVTGVTAHKAPDEEDPTKAADDDDMTVESNGIIAVFHRVTVTGAKLAEIIPVLAEADIDLVAQAVMVRNNTAGCWAAMPRQIQAEKIVEVLTEKGFAAEHRAVNDKGEILLPKGTKVAEAEDPATLTRPWNAATKAAWDALDGDALKNATKGIEGDEIIFCGHYDRDRRISRVWIVPKSYWDANQQMYPESLPIGHLLPQDLTEETPGVYTSNTRDLHVVTFDLHRRGMKESLMFQIWLNNQP